MKLLLVLVMIPFLVQSSTLKITNTDGGTVTTVLSGDIKVNKNSTLHRAWLIINEPACPVQLSADCGIQTNYVYDRVGGKYSFRSNGSIKTTEAIAAINVTFVLYDAFGDHMKSLKGVYVEDIPSNTEVSFQKLGSGSWYASENEVEQLLTVATFVRSVRLYSGKVWQCDMKAIAGELTKIRLESGSGVLEPEKPKK